jgi:PAS domain S-box-containing protein
MNKKIGILHLEDSFKDFELIQSAIQSGEIEHEYFLVDNEKDFIDVLETKNIDIILSDYSLPGYNGIEVLKIAREKYAHIPFIFVSGIIGEDAAISAMLTGATDIVFKNKLRQLIPVIKRALHEREQKLKIKLLEAGEALIKSEVKYKDLVNEVSDGYFMTNNQGIITFANVSLAKIFGFISPEEMTGHLFTEFDKKSDTQDVSYNFKNIIKNKKNVNGLEREVFRVDRNPIHIEIKAFPVLEDGKIVGMQGVIRDITERKQAEEVLRESKVKYQEIFESTGTAIFIIEEDTTILMANNECYSLMGYTPTDLVGQKWSQYITPESLQKMLKNQQLRRQNPDLALKKYEVKLVNKKGEKRDVILNVGMISGTKQHIVSISDITERKRAEQELIIANEAILQSEKNFHRSISESSMGIRIVTVDGKTIYTNKVFLDIYEFNSLEEFTSMTMINRYTPESYAQHQEKKEKRKNGHETFDYEISIVRKNAEIRHLKVSRKEILWNGIKHYQVINMDITEQKKLTIELIAAKEHAEESDRLKSAFLANMSHEIRTPMNGILGFAGLLKEPNLTGKEQQEYIQIIEKAGARMLNIINEIVDISRIESGIMKVSVSETNINSQLEYVYTLLKPEAERKGLKFFFQTSLTEKEAVIQTDQEKIYAIITNLVKNAIKYTNKGSIEFGCEIVKTDDRIAVETHGRASLRFYVKDTGIGICKDRQAAIFERFIQADIVDKMARQGAGLGLTISRAYVEMLGGKIWVESEEENLPAGKAGNTIFYFTIPYNAESLKNLNDKYVDTIEQTENQMIPEVSKLKIVIAEDDETSKMLLSIAVSPFVGEIFKTTTGTETVEVCRNNPDIDLVLMDIQMPEISGYEATRQIRKFNKDVVIIAQTAYGLAGDREKAIEAGCNDYIAKPINKTELLVLIQKYFEK